MTLTREEARKLDPLTDFFLRHAHPLVLGSIQGERFYRSDSTQMRVHYLVNLPGTGWNHTDCRCKGWLFRGSCKHVQGDDMTTEERSLVTTDNLALAHFDAIEDEELQQELAANITGAWVYQFPMDGGTVTGISAKGIEACAAGMLAMGIAVDALDVKLERETAEDAFFLAQAALSPVRADGSKGAPTLTIRGKRQPKLMTLRSGATKPDPFWYEKGVTKATRNAKLALLSPRIQAFIIAEAVKAGKVREVAPPERQQRVAPQPEGRRISSAPQQPPAASESLPDDLPPSSVTDEQRATIQGCVQSLVDAKVPFGPIKTFAAQKWPYAAVDGVFQYGQLRGDDVQAFIELLAAAMPLEQ